MLMKKKKKKSKILANILAVAKYWSTTTTEHISYIRMQHCLNYSA